MVVIDSDVLLLAFAFHNDVRQRANADFLEAVQTAQPVTTIYNVMEVLGQLSFNLTPQRLKRWESWLVNAYQLTVLWPVDPDESTGIGLFREELYERPFAKMQKERMAFMDALILGLAERTPEAECLVTWNARHFKGKSQLSILTPGEYLERVR
jgi:hypothetical protein